MSGCRFCHRDGLVFIRCLDIDGYVVAACLCPLGSRWQVKWQLRAFAAKLEPAPLDIGRLDQWFSDAELQTFKMTERAHAVTDGREYVASGR